VLTLVAGKEIFRHGCVASVAEKNLRSKLEELSRKLA
jgi:hypothetical protein